MTHSMYHRKTNIHITADQGISSTIKDVALLKKLTVLLNIKEQNNKMTSVWKLAWINQGIVELQSSRFIKRLFRLCSNPNQT